jgi:hypothetical protein
MTTNLISFDALSIGLDASERTLRSVLTALSKGKFSEAVGRFDDHFTFIDQALDLEFTDKERLIEFFRKSRELFPDTALEIESIFAFEDHAVALWKLTATQTVPYGSITYRFPIALHGSTIVHVEYGRIVQWSDYYDGSSSRRTGLASYFTEWIEY